MSGTQAVAVTDSMVSSRVRDIAASRGELLMVDDPEDPAGSLTYEELNTAADELAVGMIDALGIGEHRVGMRLATMRSFAIGVLAAERAGKTVCLVDLALPRDRVIALVSDLDPALVLSEHDEDFLPGAFSGLREGSVVRPNSLGRPPRPEDLPVPSAVVGYISYTSGSTGIPKGVMRRPPTEADQPMGALSDLFHDDAKTVAEELRVLQPSAVPYASGLAGTMAVAGTVIPYDLRTRGIAGLAATLRKERINFVSLVPTVLRTLLPGLDEDDFFPDLRIVFMVGETILWSDITGLLARMPLGSRILASLAQTEAGSMAHAEITHDSVPGEGPVTMRIPTEDGIRVTIVRPDGTEATVGEAGEIVVESERCAVGYWRRPELTAERFTHLGNGVQRVRTNDAGRLLDDGTLQHLGRLDGVVKVTGNRVDTAEVEATLRTLPAVHDVAVVPYTDPSGAVRLWAYVVGGRTSSPVPTHVLRAALTRKLPRYMVPDYLQVCEQLPRLPGGKVDRQLLIEQAGSRPEHIAPAPVGGLVGQLCADWADVLGCPTVAPDDDFFELGGDSIRAARLFAGLERQLGETLPLSLLLEFPTPAALAEAVQHGTALDDELVAIQPLGSRPPLFLLHDGAGEVVYGRRLAERLGPDQPVYAIRGAALDGIAPPQQTADELAAHYIELVRRVSPHGPYCFYGSSAGGLIAFQMALQLQSAGDAVPVLAVGDVHWTNPGDPPEPDGWQRITTLVRTRRFRDAGLFPIGHLRWRVQDRRRRRSEEDSRQALAMAYYGGMLHSVDRSARYDGSVLVFRAMNTLSLPGDPRPDLGWRPHCTLPPTVCEVRCAHPHLGMEAGVPFIAKPLAQALERVGSG